MVSFIPLDLRKESRWFFSSNIAYRCTFIYHIWPGRHWCSSNLLRVLVLLQNHVWFDPRIWQLYERPQQDIWGVWMKRKGTWLVWNEFSHRFVLPCWHFFCHDICGYLCKMSIGSHIPNWHCFCSIQYVLSSIDTCIQYGEDADVKVRDFEEDED